MWSIPCVETIHASRSSSLFVVIFLNFMRFIITERQKIYASNSLSVVTVHSEG